MKKFRYYFILTALVISCTTSTIVQAKTVSQLQQEQQELKRKQEEAKKKLEENQSTQKEIEQEIADLDQKLSQAQADLNAVEAQLDDTQKRLEQSKEDLQTATKEKETQFNAFSKRVRYIHENGSLGYLNVVLEAKSFNDLILRMQYVNDIMKYDKETLESLRQKEEIIDQKTKEIAQEEKNVEVLVDMQQKKTDEFKQLLGQKQTKLDSYKKDAAEIERQMAEDAAASDEVERLIVQAQQAAAAAARSRSSTSSVQPSSGASYTGGKLGWPVAGRTYISSGYVSRERPIGSGIEFHTGLDIPAPYGYNIQAGEAGVVIKSGWVRGYGNTIIIDHGGGLSTLYGHNSSLVVSQGEYVTRGQVIAKCGSTGNSTGNHCHYEVRLNGKATNPWTYLQ